MSWVLEISVLNARRKLIVVGLFMLTDFHFCFDKTFFSLTLTIYDNLF